MGGGSGFNGRMLGVLLIAVSMAASTGLETQAEECRLYQVTGDQPSPIMKGADGLNVESYISFDLLFDNSTATITIFDGASSMLLGNTKSANITGDVDSSSSCQITVNKANLTLLGSCFDEREIPLKCSKDGGMNTIELIRRGTLLVVSVDGDASDNKVLNLKAAEKMKGILVQVSSNTIVNTAFNCRSSCFQFNNAMLHSKDILVLTASQTTLGDDGDTTGVIKVLHGEAWEEETAFNFTFPQKTEQIEDGDISQQFSVVSQYENDTNSLYLLSVSGSLIDIDAPYTLDIVPSSDTYFKFENMDTILWTMCEDDQVYITPSTDIATDETEVITQITTENKVNSSTENITSDDQNIDHSEIDTGTEVTSQETKGMSTTLTISLTTDRFKEEMICKDTRPPICALTANKGGSCSCSEAKAHGWCDDSDNHPDVQESCKKTCGLCPDQAGVANGEPDVTETTNHIEGRNNVAAADDSILATKSPYARNEGGNTFVYVMIGIVVVMLLVLVIWLTCKKRKARGQMDIEGQSQSMSLKESTEKTSENNKDTEKIGKQEKEENNEGAKNNGFQEQDEVKENNKPKDDKDNANDENKVAEENSPTKDEKDSKNTEDNSPTNKEIESKTEKDVENKVDEEDDASPKGDIEKDHKTEIEDENASKGISDSLENEKSI